MYTLHVWPSNRPKATSIYFPSSSNRIKATRDGKFIMATGTYKPRMRVFEFAEMSMKFERHTNSENVNFTLLSDDWTKSVHLMSDRYLEFHSHGEMHYRTRIPAFGRDLAYHRPTCDLLVTGAQSEVYRLNLEEGRFMKPFETSSAAGVNVVDINPAHQLFGFGTESGTVEFWDPRAKRCIGTVVPSASQAIVDPSVKDYGVTALKFHDDGLSCAVGTSAGQVMLYDLRNASPYLSKDHRYSLPIKSLAWHTSAMDTADRQHRVISTDSKVIRIWDKFTGKQMTSIEASRPLNDVCVLGNSGMMFAANEGADIYGFYIPALGPAPRCCSFLDNLTEEMEENPKHTIYDDYKFVTRKELSSLSLDHLVGTNLLRPYMHGFFVNLRLYDKAKSIAEPFAYDEYREKQLRTILDKEQASRIQATGTKKERKVNRLLAERAAKQKSLLTGHRSKSDGAAKNLPSLLHDSRFTAMFEDPDFEIDSETQEFQALQAGQVSRHWVLAKPFIQLGPQALLVLSYLAY
ncbi:WD40-repeat-containing domain protein [Dimargaris cristalligena]|uniref:WD40-repeat-containing domain protein n=1 Tax=Dimargaris cristalligena TaxID=215637 RepID=A0A4P9ZIZ8_9FUNG|nr:WD40-repeat-containing domain protein [Dimargaris cristalligena]|eukprot:RKP33196.1 WD40-repeat-containing domain protein [Dimargaris cristalligena]